MKKIILFSIVATSVFSCKEKQQNVADSLDNKNSLRFELMGGNQDNRIVIVMNMKNIKDTLVISKCYNDYVDSCQIIKQPITKAGQDSLYLYFKNALDKFKIDEGANRSITGRTIKLSVFSEFNSMSISYSGVERLDGVNPDITQIVNFLNQRTEKICQ